MSWLNNPMTLVRHALVLGLLAVVLPRDAGAQVRRPAAGPSGESVFLPPPRELIQLLSRARNELANEQYVDAIARLDVILGGEGEYAEDYFLPQEKGRPLRTLKSEALRLIGEMAAAGREVYELQHGTEARKQLEEAVRKRDMQQLAHVSRRYFHTDAGYDATLLAGRDRLERGEPLAAVIQLQRLSQAASARQRFGAELPLLTATALRMSGRNEQARAALLSMRSAAEQTSIVVRGQRVPLFDAGEDPLAWLADHTGTLGEEIRVAADEWRMFGGDARRSAICAVDMPMKAKRWDVPLTIDVQDELLLMRQEKSLVGEAPTPVFHPLVVNNTVLMRTLEGLLAVDLESGLRIWPYPWSGDEDDLDPLGSSALGSSQRAQLIKERVFEDALYGQISSDGKSVFLLEQLNGFSSSLTLTNQLVALELAREGYSIWAVGGSSGEDEPKLAGIYFLGPPLPIEDKLYVIGEINGEVRLVVLSAETGKQIWSQQLAHVEAGNFSRVGNPSRDRRNWGVNPCYADGVLICPTGVGGVVAVDVINRTFLWGFSYQPRNMRQANGPRLDRWRDGSVMIADGKVILTPFDSDQLYCLDLLTGESIWKREGKRNSAIYVAGTHDENVILVGKSAVSSLNLATGDDVWTLPLNSSPAGRGAQSGTHYFLATKHPELLKIDLAEGKVVERMTSDIPLGNLVAYQGDLISQGSYGLRTYYQRDKLRERVETILAGNPRDPWGLEKLGLLLLDEGKRVAGLERLREAAALYPRDGSGNAEAAKDLLAKTILQMLRDDEPGSAELAAELESLMDGETQRNELLRLMALSLQRAGKYAEAFRKRLDLHLVDSRIDQERLEGLGNDLLDVGQHRRMRKDRWHRAGFRDLWEQAPPVAREELTTLIDQAWTAASPAYLTSLADALQDIDVVHERYLAWLQDHLTADSSLPIAEGKLMRFATSSDTGVAATATLMLAQIYQQAGRIEAAALAFARLRRDFGGHMFPEQLTGAQLCEDAIASDEQIRVALASNAWPFGQVEVTKAPPAPDTTSGPFQSSPFDRYGFNQQKRMFPVATEHPLSVPPPGMNLVFNLDDVPNGKLQGRNAAGRVIFETAVPIPIGGRDVLYRTHGHLIVASRNDMLVAINGLASTAALDEKIIWEESGEEDGMARSRSARATRRMAFKLGLSRTVESGAKGQSVVSLGPVSERGIILRRWGELVCLDPANRGTIWSRSDLQADAEVWGDDEFVFAHSPQEKLARVFSAMDGRELEKRIVPPPNQRIRCFGRYVLNYREDLDGGSVGVRLQLNDLFESWVWNHTFSEDARAAFVGEDEIAVFDPTRGLQVFSIFTGEMIVDTPLQTELEKVHRLLVEKRSGQYIVTLGMNTSGRTADVQYRSPQAPEPLLDMEVHAFDLKTGEARWPAPAKLTNYTPMDFVAPELPILVFMRRAETTPKRRLETLVLDARDGRAILEEAGDLDGRMFDVHADRETHRIQLNVPAADGSWSLTFSDEPHPPSPPYGNSTTVTKANTGPLELLNSMIKAVRKSVPKQKIELDTDDLFDAPE